MVRLLESPLESLDAWITRQPPPQPSRPEAIRRLIELGLEAASKKAPR